MSKRWIGLLILVPFLGACATVPAGPSVMVLPGSGKSFEQFQADDAMCRQWAYQQTGTTPGEAAGASGAQSAGYHVQRRYDIAYQQCMYAKGNQIPGVARTYRGGVPPPPPPPPASGSPPPGSAAPPPPAAPR